MPDSSETGPVHRVLPCPAEVRLSDGTLLQALFWLLADPASPSGVTPLHRLLDGQRQFLAVGLEDGASALLGRDAIVTATLSADDPGAPAADEAATLDVVTLHLDGADKVSGVLRAVSPAGSQRMSDLFNGPERFLALSLGAHVVLVNKARVTRVSF